MSRKRTITVNSWKTGAAVPNNFYVHLTKAGDRYSYPEHTHSGYCELVYVLDGKFVHRINGSTICHNSACFVLIRERDRHEIRGGRFVFMNIAFALAWIEDLEKFARTPGLISRLFSRKAPLRVDLKGERRSAFEQSARSLMTQARRPRGAAMFSRFLLNIITDNFNWAIIPAASDHPMPDWMRETVLAVDDRKSLENYTVKDLVRESCRCPEHVSRSFRKHLGVSPSQFINRKRIERAAQLLVHTNYPLLDICFLTGFENPSYFHRLFKAKHGVSPRKYRLSHVEPYSA